MVEVTLTKPMGITFEENAPELGGLYVHKVGPDGSAAAQGIPAPGDQVLAVDGASLKGLPFDGTFRGAVSACSRIAPLPPRPPTH